MDEFASYEIVIRHSSLQCLVLVGIVTVVDAHVIPGPDESIVLESGQTAHSPSSSSMPVETSAEHMGQVTVGTMPTMNVNPHSGHSIFGIGFSGSGGGGGGGAPPAGATPGAAW